MDQLNMPGGMGAVDIGDNGGDGNDGNLLNGNIQDQLKKFEDNINNSLAEQNKTIDSLKKLQNNMANKINTMSATSALGSNDGAQQ